MPHTMSNFSGISEHVVPLHAEEAEVSRVRVEGQTTRVDTVTHERNHDIDELVFRETVEVEHVPVGREVDVAPEIRRDGDLTIIPVMEEIIVVTRKLVLKEEIHLRRLRSTARHQETITLRAQQAIITRAPPAETSAEAPTTLSTPDYLTEESEI